MKAKDTFSTSKKMHDGNRWITFSDVNNITHTIPVGSMRLNNKFICESKNIDEEPDEMECSISYDGEKYVVDYAVWMEVNDYLMTE